MQLSWAAAQHRSGTGMQLSWAAAQCAGFPIHPLLIARDD
jgi:hypothetical protein